MTTRDTFLTIIKGVKQTRQKKTVWQRILVLTLSVDLFKCALMGGVQLWPRAITLHLKGFPFTVFGSAYRVL